jgi:hypothetical protein
MVTNKYFTRDKNYTHLLLDGGKINIPENINEQFLNLYSKDIESSNPNFLCEVRTDIFKFYIDLDFLYISEINDTDLLFYTYNIQRILDYLIDNTSTNKNISKCVVCLSQPCSKKNLIKMGVHLMFPNLLLNKETALLIRNIIVEYFKNTFYSNEHMNWEDIIDETVYKQNGLRMLGSSKIEKCSLCKNKKGDCLKCYGTKKYDVNRYYIAKYIIKNNTITYLIYNKNSKYLNHYKKIDNTSKFINNLNENFINFEKKINNKYYKELNFDFNNFEIKKKIKSFSNIINLVSIRTYTNFLYDLKEIEFPCWIREIICNKNETPTNNTPHLTPIQSNFMSKVKKNSDFKNINVREVISITSELGNNIINLVKTSYSFYREEPFKEILFMGNYYIVSTNSKYCMNVDREHTGNHVYFIIDNYKLYQKCFSLKASSDQKFGLCKDYQSKPKILNKYMKNYLFNVFELSPIIKRNDEVNNIKINVKSKIKEDDNFTNDLSKQLKKIKSKKKKTSKQINLNNLSNKMNMDKMQNILYKIESKIGKI